MKLSRRSSIKLAGPVLGALCAGLPAVSAGPITNLVNMAESYESLQSLKNGVLWASKWWDVRFRGNTFAVCLQDFPSYGQSKQSVHAWLKDEHARFNLVWSIRTLGIGPLEIIIDDIKGSISVKAIGQTDLKGNIIGFVQLAATTG